MPHSVAIVTLGCPKNQVDSEAMASLLKRKGIRLINKPDRADFIVVNTCGFIEAARQESLNELKELAARKNSRQKLIAAGCLAEFNPALLRTEVPEINAILSTKRWNEIADLLEELADGSVYPAIWTGDPKRLQAMPQRSPAGATAYVKIAEGCSGPCAFCTIPLIKGPLRSRPAQEVVAEVADLVARGYKEIILVAQDTTAYGRDRGERDGLPKLIEAITDAAPGLPWLRIMYTYPPHISERLIEVIAATPQVCHYLDLPLQHAHPAVLRRMRRPTNVEAVKELVERLRAVIPDVVLRTTFIVGYPGETEEEFLALMDFVAAVRFDHVGVFPYSRELRTPAYDMESQVSEGVKEERRGALLELQQGISLEINQSLVGRELDVLIEGAGDGISVGRTYRDAPEVDGLSILTRELAPGTMLRARVIQAMEYDLVMEPL